MRQSNRVKSETVVERTSDNENWRHWCRLCALDKMPPDACNSEERTRMDVELATAIGKYFWVNIRITDELPQNICIDCYTLVTQLGEFTERVQKVQTMYTVLQNMTAREPVDPQEIRLQFGLLDDDWQHMIKQHSLEGPSDCEVESEMHEVGVGDEEKQFISTRENSMDITTHQQNEISYEYVDEVVQEKQRRMPKTELQEVSEEVLIFDGVQGLGHMEQNTDEEDDLNEAHEDGQVEGDEDDEEVEDSDLFKELNFHEEDEEEVYAGSEPAEEEHQDQDVPVTEEDEKYDCTVAVNPEGLKLLKRKRGRPPKSEVKRRRAENSDSEGSPDGGMSRKYGCSVCHRQYKNPTSYRKHMIDVHQKEPDIPEFVCEKCPDRTFPTERQLAVHGRTHLPLKEKMNIPCPYCERKFTKLAVMRQHVNGIHFNEKPFICDACGRPLKTLAALNEHKLVHTNDCPYECTVCLKSFKNRSRLKIHSDTHTETLYDCTVCGMKLNTRRTLKMHMLVHTNEKQYKCNFCAGAFKRAKALKNHLILHTGMRPYKCNFCDKSFSNGSNCRSHKRKMHPKELALEEAQGKRCEPTVVPKLDELRIGSNLVPNPREGSTQSPPMRLMKLAKTDKRTQSGLGIQATLGEAESAALLHYDGIVHEEVVVGDDDDETETVIYEIIDEI